MKKISKYLVLYIASSIHGHLNGAQPTPTMGQMELFRIQHPSKPVGQMALWKEKIPSKKTYPVLKTIHNNLNATKDAIKTALKDAPLTTKIKIHHAVKTANHAFKQLDKTVRDALQTAMKKRTKNNIEIEQTIQKIRTYADNLKRQVIRLRTTIAQALANASQKDRKNIQNQIEKILNNVQTALKSNS